MIAALVALSVAPAAFADYVSAQTDGDVAFTVKTKALTGYDADGNAQYGDEKVAKTYTAAELKAIAVKKDANEAPAYLMFTSKKKKTTVYVATEYVLLTKLLEDAGISNVKAAELINYYTRDEGSASDTVYSSVSLTGSRLMQDLMFFPNHVSMTEGYQGSDAIPNEVYVTEGAYAVPSIIALGYCSADITRSQNATADSARIAAAAKTPESVQRSFFGQTIDEYKNDGLPMGGTASVNNATGLLVTLNSIENATVSAIPDATYTGKAIMPAVKEVSIGSKKLTEGTDYKVSYKNNVNAGTASAVITGAGEFCGTITKTFKIAPASSNALTGAKSKISKSFPVKKLKKAKSFKLPKVSATFGTVKWSVAKKDKKKVLKLKKGKVTVKKGAKKGTYTIKLKASVGATANYAGVSKTITVKVKITNK